MEEQVDYKLQRQKQQEARFKARGATWQPSGKPCTLQFVFDEVPESSSAQIRNQNVSSNAPPELVERQKRATTRVPSPPTVAGEGLQSKPRFRQTKTQIISKTDSSDTPGLSVSAAPSRKPRKPTKVINLNEDTTSTNALKAEKDHNAKEFVFHSYMHRVLH